MNKILKFGFLCAIFFCFANNAFAETLNERVFYVDPVFSQNSSSYTLKAKQVLQKNGLEIYIDNNYWNTKTTDEQDQIQNDLIKVSERFKENQSKVISLFGREAYPGIDNNTNLIVLLHPLKMMQKDILMIENMKK